MCIYFTKNPVNDRKITFAHEEQIIDLSSKKQTCSATPWGSDLGFHPGPEAPPVCSSPRMLSLDPWRVPFPMNFL